MPRSATAKILATPPMRLSFIQYCCKFVTYTMEF